MIGRTEENLRIPLAKKWEQFLEKKKGTLEKLVEDLQQLTAEHSKKQKGKKLVELVQQY